jgi:hypothetical protein
VDSLADYRALALKLAQPSMPRSNPAKLASMRDSCALFDTQRFTRHLEAAYFTMWQRCQQGLLPGAFGVNPSNGDERGPHRESPKRPTSVQETRWCRLNCLAAGHRGCEFHCLNPNDAIDCQFFSIFSAPSTRPASTKWIVRNKKGQSKGLSGP